MVPQPELNIPHIQNNYNEAKSSFAFFEGYIFQIFPRREFYLTQELSTLL